MEVLACPHCDRLFQVTPAALGKKIRCRGCRGIFHVPQDTTNVPLGLQESISSVAESGPAIAIPCVIDGHDARSCPECGRTFRMKEAFAGKKIRCRGCEATFRVRASEASPQKQVRPELAPVEANGTAAPSAPHQPVPAAPVIRPAPPPPVVFEDIGDVLDDLLPGEQVASVVRPENVPRLSAVASNPLMTMIAVVVGGFCALPATAWILAMFFPERYREIVAGVPDFIRGWLP